uniref:Uncharacterized protein n=1 Tax=Moniliophthora roreri TaxID=221103 RepID=A0A0W0FEJ6_MONRR
MRSSTCMQALISAAADSEGVMNDLPVTFSPFSELSGRPKAYKKSPSLATGSFRASPKKIGIFGRSFSSDVISTSEGLSMRKQDE